MAVLDPSCMERIPYAKARELVRVGDVVAFGGSGLISRIIRSGAKTVVSHAGVIVAPLDGDEEPRFLESTIRLRGTDPVLGPKITSFEDRWSEYEGNVWLLPLAEAIRARFNEKKFADFVFGCEDKLFDIPEGVRMQIKEFLEQLAVDGAKAEQFYFCSELIAAAFKEADILPGLAPSEVSPKDLCRWKMYDDTYYARDTGHAVRTIPMFNLLPLGTIRSG